MGTHTKWIRNQRLPNQVKPKSLKSPDANGKKSKVDERVANECVTHSLRWSHTHFICIPAFTSFHSVFHSSHGLMNSINWPAFSVWIFVAQLGEHCSANVEATGSNPVEAPKIFFSGFFRNCLNCDSLRWSHTHFICIPAVHIISFSV